MFLNLFFGLKAAGLPVSLREHLLQSSVLGLFSLALMILLHFAIIVPKNCLDLG